MVVWGGGGLGRSRRIFGVSVLNGRNVRCRGIWDTTIAGCKHEDTALACKHSRAANPFLDFSQILRRTRTRLARAYYPEMFYTTFASGVIEFR